MPRTRPATAETSLYRPLADTGRLVTAFHAVAFRDGVAYDVEVSLDAFRLESLVADALDDRADTVGNPAYDDTHRTDDGIVFRLKRRED